MKDQEAIQMMQRCSSEIKSLRAQIARLHPMAEAYETLKSVIGLLPQKSIGMGEDLAWRLDQEISKIEKKIADAKVDPQGGDA